MELGMTEEDQYQAGEAIKRTGKDIPFQRRKESVVIASDIQSQAQDQEYPEPAITGVIDPRTLRLAHRATVYRNPLISYQNHNRSIANA